MSSDTASVRDFLLFVVQSLVEHPDEVCLDEVDSDKQTTFELSVHPDDLSAVLGDNRSVAQALDTVLSACAYKQRSRASLRILDGAESSHGEEATA